MNKIPLINQIIKDKKKELKINQSEFAKMLKKSLSTIKRYDSGSIIPLDTLIITCDILNLDITDLLKSQMIDNEFNKTKYYWDIIISYHDIIKTTTKSQQNNDDIQNYLSLILRFHLKMQGKKTDNFSIKISNNKYYIKDGDKTLSTFTPKQATEFTNFITEYIEFFIFKCQNKNLTK